MRILFVSGTSTGGSARSTEELAARLHGRGHHVATLMACRPRPVPGQIEGGRGPYAVLAAQAARVERVFGQRFGGRPSLAEHSAYPKWHARFPAACLSTVCEQHRPDVVVVTSLDHRAWQSVRTQLAVAGIACVLYVRAEDTVRRLAEGPPPGLAVSNAHALAGAARELGIAPVVVPSVVELDRCRVESMRERVLFVNPIAMRGLGTVLAMAGARPAIPFVVHETAVLDRRDRARLRAQVGALANVEVRAPVADPRALYRDARILLAPYLVSNRPRVVLEAQSNAIPVLAADVPGLRECVPPGGLLVPPAAPVEEWVQALDELWDDPSRYAEVAAAAKRHSVRAEVEPAAVAARFEEALSGLLESRAQRARARS
jgi:glycosyltransferase involved in cell wall biosynthesis